MVWHSAAQVGVWAIAISRERNLLSGSFQDSQVTFLCIIAVVRYLLLIKLSDLVPGQFPNDLLSGGAAQRPCLCGPAHGSMSCGPASNKPVRPSGTDARIYHMSGHGMQMWCGTGPIQSHPELEGGGVLI